MKAKKEVQEIQGTKQEFLKVFRKCATAGVHGRFGQISLA